MHNDKVNIEKPSINAKKRSLLENEANGRAMEDGTIEIENTNTHT